MTLNCEISSNAANFSIIWEHNGVPINDSSMYDGFNDSSTLTIKRPSLVESEGRYRCRVDYQHHNFSMVSREAHFETPRESFYFCLPRYYSIIFTTFGHWLPTKKDTKTIKNGVYYEKLGKARC